MSEPSKRSRFQFHLRMLMLFVAIVAVPCAVCLPALREWLAQKETPAWTDLGGSGSIIGQPIREPEWWEHRMLKGVGTDVNLHVFTAGCPEVDRMLRFRDHLRGNPADRRIYEVAKRGLAARDWAYVQNYADAKTNVIEEIIARANSWPGKPARR